MSLLLAAGTFVAGVGLGWMAPRIKRGVIRLARAAHSFIFRKAHAAVAAARDESLLATEPASTNAADVERTETTVSPKPTTSVAESVPSASRQEIIRPSVTRRPARSWLVKPALVYLVLESRLSSKRTYAVLLSLCYLTLKLLCGWRALTIALVKEFMQASGWGKRLASWLNHVVEALLRKLPRLRALMDDLRLVAKSMAADALLDEGIDAVVDHAHKKVSSIGYLPALSTL